MMREVSDSFVRALVAVPLAAPLDQRRAVEQHSSYAAALRARGVSVHMMPALHEHPDACFVEDVAVVMMGRALLTRPGHPSRRGEVDSVAQLLSARMPSVRMHEGCLDGGDVLAVGRRIYVGRSARTDSLGVAALARCFPECEIVEVALRAGLHLKSGATALPDGRLLVCEDSVDPRAFREPTIAVDRDEGPACNVVSVGDVLLVPAGFPKTSLRLAREGFSVYEIDNSELRKADSALTCLSILV